MLLSFSLSPQNPIYFIIFCPVWFTTQILEVCFIRNSNDLNNKGSTFKGVCVCVCVCFLHSVDCHLCNQLRVECFFGGVGSLHKSMLERKNPTSIQNFLKSDMTSFGERGNQKNLFFQGKFDNVKI